MERSARNGRDRPRPSTSRSSFAGLRPSCRLEAGRGAVPAGGALLCLAGALLLLGLSFRWGGSFERNRPARPDPAELTFFPHGPAARPFCLGRARLASDLAWLTAIQYYGRHRMTDRKYPFAESLFGTLTDLDPAFEEAYVFGALVLAEPGAGSGTHGARRLLEKGMAHNPGSWRLPFEYGFLSYFEGTNPEEAARYLVRAGKLPGAPLTVSRLAAHAAERAGERDVAAGLWREMLRSSDNQEVRRIARARLRELGEDS